MSELRTFKPPMSNSKVKGAGISLIIRDEFQDVTERVPRRILEAFHQGAYHGVLFPDGSMLTRDIFFGGADRFGRECVVS